jgi:hypothetical protein
MKKQLRLNSYGTVPVLNAHQSGVLEIEDVDDTSLTDEGSIVELGALVSSTIEYQLC